MSFVAAIQSPMNALLKQFGATVSYTPLGGAAASFKAFVRGIREDDLFMEALQRDSVAVLNADDFIAATGKDTPRRLDRLTTPTGTYTVEAWRAAPDSGPAVFFKLLLRGGQQ
jgi:hypothetical protein